MKLALKYGLTITAGIIVWVIVAHLLVPNSQSKVHSLGAVFFFNTLEFIVIFLGIRALERERGDKPTFKEGLKLGVAIAFVYAVSAGLFFVGVLLVIGPKWMQSEPSALRGMALWWVAAQAFIGLCGFGLLFGLVYSTLISFALAKRRSHDV